jgi:putative DNA primase/helicase
MNDLTLQQMQQVLHARRIEQAGGSAEDGDKNAAAITTAEVVPPVGATAPTIALLNDECKSSPADTPTMKLVKMYADWGIRLTAANADKTPAIKDWPNDPIAPENFKQYFGGATPKRPAALLGYLSKGLSDSDIDSDESRAIACHPKLEFLTSGMLPFGKPGKPPGHYLVFCPEATDQDNCRTVQFSLPKPKDDTAIKVADEHGLMFTEARGNGSYTILPNGDDIVWTDIVGRTIPQMPWAELVRRTGLIGAAGFLIRHYPPVGERNNYNLALHGTFVRALRSHYGEDEALLNDHVDRLVLAICQLAGDLGHGPSWEKRAANTLAKLKAGADVTGLPKLLDIIGAPYLAPTLRRWLGADMEAEDCLDPTDWTGNARKFVLKHMPYLRFHNGMLLDYSAGAYREIEQAAVSARVRTFLDGSKILVVVAKNGAAKPMPFKPNKKSIDEEIAAIKDICHIERDTLAPPCWFPDHDGVKAAPLECISLRNGVLHVPSDTLYPPTPNFFTLNALDFDFNADAKCPLWNNTLREFWSDKADGTPADEILKLQEIFGYHLTPDTSLQKIFFYHGETRSGKGTVTFILMMLLGASNCASTSARALTNDFGAAALIGKSAAFFPEMVFGAKDDRAGVTSLLKAISGEDHISINRKNKPFWEGRLTTRLNLVGQKIPNFADDSTALGTRLEILRFTRSFAGKEDTELKSKLSAELPGILNWAIEGRKRLWVNGGRFTQTATGNEDRETLNRLASPARAFCVECCVQSPSAFVTEDAIYKAFRDWCESNGVHGDTKAGFIETLTAVVYPGQVAKHRHDFSRDAGHRGNDKRPRGLKGIQLKDLLAARGEGYGP